MNWFRKFMKGPPIGIPEPDYDIDLSSALFQCTEKLRLLKTRIQFTDIASLSDALIRAKDAHVQFEKGLGRPDTNWPLWYASYIAMEQGLAVSSSLIPKPKCCVTQPSEIDEITGDHISDEYWSTHE